MSVANHPNRSVSWIPKVSLFVMAMVVLFFLGKGLHAGDRSDWTDNHQQALASAKQTNRRVLMDFTGSDWCGACIQLDREVLSTPEFKSYAQKNFVLLELDFPREKYIDPRTMKQNQTLQQEYQVEGFPTIIVLNPDGKKIGEISGYAGDGPKAFIAALEKLPKT